MKFKSSVRMPGPVIFFEDGIPKTTSQEVARIFGKKHYDVLAAIRNPIIPNDFHGRNFTVVDIVEENSIGGIVNRRHYKLTQDGFNLIAMGFTGKKAMLHKIAFIDAFNAIADELMRIRLQGPETTRQIEGPTAKCGHCRKVLPLSAFHLDSHRLPPVQSWCKYSHEVFS